MGYADLISHISLPDNGPSRWTGWDREHSLLVGGDGNGRFSAQNRSIAPTLRTARCLSLRDIGTLGA
jgi:hypothetical protein